MSTVKFEKIGRGVYSILLNRPKKANAVNLELCRALRDTLDRFEHEDECKVAIVSGIGGNFCSGYDLNEFVDPTTGMPNIQLVQKLLWPVRSSRLSEKKLTIAAIDGHAAGFGFELALKCDFRVAERSARMGFLNRRFGIPIMSGGTVILPRLIGYPRAADLVATGRAQLAPESLQYGLINHISDVGCSIGKALNLARCLIKFPRDGLLHDLNKLRDQDRDKLSNMLLSERKSALDYLSNRVGPLELAVKFLSGDIGRHGNTDLGNMISSNPEVTL
jgi:enoyl-CoA hydratase